MGMTSPIRRDQGSAVETDLALRLAEPRSTAEVLGPLGTQVVQRAAKVDRNLRDKMALAEALADVMGDINQHPKDIVARKEARHWGTSVIDPNVQLADPRLVAKYGAELCLKHRILPWKNVGGRVTVLAATTRDFLKVRDALTVLFGPVHLAITTPENLDRALRRLCHKTLMHNAEYRTKPDESCRNWSARRAALWGGLAALATVSSLFIWPQTSFLVLSGWAIFVLILNTLLKATAAALHILKPTTEKPIKQVHPRDLPIVTILVPLYKERDVAGALVRRLSRIDYPEDKLDLCLVLEADDGTTQNALAGADLPHWMRAIKVPLGTLQTKPRALNYALSFAKGSIIGVYDAEDAPAPDQLHVVVNRFAHADRDVACLQGRLDFYNSHSNWLARCFTVEYATWFRIILPGLERLGLAIPLGGTTLFFKRDILEELGGWDAHNVTEDADLGIRLTRHGYRTEIIDSTTQEEANARTWPWIKQRSRWLKGYAITYGVHMRNPLKLWRDLGAWRFFGVQLLLMGTITQFLLAPLLWSFWLMLLDLPHPLNGVLSKPVALTFAGIFLLSEVINIAVSALAVTSARKRELIKWTPTLHFYFPLAALAAHKGVIELATKPFYWDKTSHGIFSPTQAKVVNPQPQPLPHPIAAE